MRRRAGFPGLAGGWLLAVVLMIPTPAAAQDLAPQIDRNSPAGVEYQLPAERAREQASGVRPGTSAPDAEPPLFGVGITRGPDAPSPRAKGTANPDSDEAPGGATTNRRRGPARTPATRATVRAHGPQPQGSGGALAVVGAGGAGVMLVGGLAGLGWRRRRSVAEDAVS